MTAKEFDFEFTHQRRKFKGNLQVMNPFKQKMYRVFVPTKDKNGEVFIFYEVNEPNRRFFYHYTDSFKDEMAKSIMKLLNQY
jgi:hypothetical protein